MKCLLDTHTFLWALTETNKLSRKAIDVIKNPRNEIYVSSITFWEISIKTRIKKLDLDDIVPEDLIPLAEKMEFELISLAPEEAITYHKLDEAKHKDPFDRMLIWQSISRDLVLISKDKEFKNFLPFGLKLLW